jgi:hypothetical protein
MSNWNPQVAPDVDLRPFIGRNSDTGLGFVISLLVGAFCRDLSNQNSPIVPNLSNALLLLAGIFAAITLGRELIRLVKLLKS